MYRGGINITFIYLLSALFLLAIVVVKGELNKINKHIDNIIQFTQTLPELSETEIKTLQRQVDFSNRIDLLKEELANQTYMTRSGKIIEVNNEPAEILHPMIKNLPHSVIGEDNIYPDEIEVAD